MEGQIRPRDDAAPAGRLPVVDDAAVREKESLLALEKAFHPSVVIRREVSPDYGVDAWGELMQVADDVRQATNCRFAIQVKASVQPNRLGDDSVSYPVDVKNVRYLEAQPIAIYVLYDATTQTLLWVWHHEAVGALDRSGRAWRAQEAVSIRFARELDAAAVSEIGLEVATRFALMQELADGPGLFRGVRAIRSARDGAGNRFVGRRAEISELVSHLEPRRVVNIVGPPDVGKTQLVSEMFSARYADALQQQFALPLAIIMPRTGDAIGPHPLARAFLIALGARRATTSDLSETAGGSEQAVSALREVLAARCRGFAPLAVIDDADRLVRAATELPEVGVLLEEPVFTHGAAIVISSTALACGESFDHLVLNLEPLSLEDALALAEAVFERGADACEVLRELDEPAVRLPGVIVRAAEVERAAAALSPLDWFVEAARIIARRLLEPRDVTGDARRDSSFLYAWAVMGGLPLPSDLVADHLDATTADDLRRIGLVEDRDTNTCGLSRLAVWVLRGDLQRAVASDERDVLDAIARESGDMVVQVKHSAASRDQLGSALEQGVSWLRSQTTETKELQDVLLMSLAPLAIADVALPMSRVEAERLLHDDGRWQSGDRGDALVARASVAARFGTATELMDALDSVAEHAESAVVAPLDLVAIDEAAYIGNLRFGLPQGFIELRDRLARRLVANSSPSESSALVWARWNLNTSGLCLAVDDHRGARQHMREARVLLDSMWGTSVASRAEVAVYARLVRLEVRLGDPAEGERLLAIALAWAERHLGLAPWSSDALRDFGTTARALLASQPSDIALETRARTAECALERALGSPETWSLSAHAERLSLRRTTVLMSQDSAARDLVARQALDELDAFTTPLNAPGSTRLLLEQAAFHQALARLDHQPDGEFEHLASARRLLEKALRHPTAEAWFAALSAGRPDEEWEDPNDGVFLTHDFDRKIEACRVWLRERGGGWRNGRLALLCLEHDWRSRGSIAREAQETFIRHSEGGWERAPSTQKLVELSRVYGRRQSELEEFANQYGEFIELTLAGLRVDVQYLTAQRLYGGGDREARRDAHRVFAAARQRWPHSLRIREAEARYHRYAWDWDGAVAEFEALAQAARDSLQRHRFTALLVDALLGAVAEGRRVRTTSGDVLGRRDAMRWAAALLEDCRVLDPRYSLLGQRVAIERGEPVDWSSHDLRIGELLAGDPLQLPASAHELRMLGHLYLRAAELQVREPLQAVQIAYRAFTAGRDADVFRYGNERASTAYLRARAIVVAVEAARDPAPFIADPEGSPTLLDLARRLLGGAAGRSVGGFNVEIRAMQSRADRADR